MEIILDEESIKTSGHPDQPGNTPEELVQRFKAKLEKMGNFMGADKIEHQERHKKEVYIITKGENRLVITAHGGGSDGGWLGVE